MLIVGAASLAACSPRAPAAAVHDNNWILSRLNARIGRIDPSTGGQRELHYLVRNQAGGDEIICGWTGFPPGNGADPPFPQFPRIFVFRDGRLFLSDDMTPKAFEALQDQVCGHDWIKAEPMPPAPS